MEHRTEAQNTLRQTGFTEWEIDQLERLRQRYATPRDGLDDFATYCRLQFIRWLVTTGRLTEQIAEGEVPGSGNVGRSGSSAGTGLIGETNLKSIVPS